MVFDGGITLGGGGLAVGDKRLGGRLPKFLKLRKSGEEG